MCIVVRINKLIFQNIRNHKLTEIELHPNINIFRGLNGVGKTSILEAIAIAGLSKSFQPVGDSIVLNRDANDYSVSLNATNDYGIPYFVSIKYTKNEKKIISNTIGDNLLPKDIIGELPLVVLSPDFKEITFGSPSERRALIDRILSQSYKTYLADWLKLKRILRQRSAFLTQYLKNNAGDCSQFDIWTQLLIEVSAEIIWKRLDFIEKFSTHFIALYEKVSRGKETVQLKYRPFDIKDVSSKQSIKQQLELSAEKYRDDELRRGINLFGPQRDDLKILINGGSSREFASQGQHKSLLIAIKFAEFRFLKEILNETPVILLDDIFSELDQERIEQVLRLVDEHKAQTFITVNYANFLNSLPQADAYALFDVQDGEVAEASR